MESRFASPTFDYMPYMLMDVGENVVVSKEFIAMHKK